MKICPGCGQSLAEEIKTCPNCGCDIGEGRLSIDEYQITEVLHEGHASTLCRAFKEGEDTPVLIRIFNRRSGVDEKIAERLKAELEKLRPLPKDYFVQHYDIKQSADGIWYRVSEWVDMENWGTLLTSGLLRDYRITFALFKRMASILDGLHKIGHIIPHLTLNDIMVIKCDAEELRVKVDFKVSRFLDPKMDRPGPMLKNLLACHPDIKNQRPLDVRSDIWALGKIFVEILTGELSINDYAAKIDELPLPPKIKTLIKVMLAEDPDLRPASMTDIAQSLSQIKNKDIKFAERDHVKTARASQRDVKGLKKWVRFLAIAVFTFFIIGGMAAYYFGSKKSDPVDVLIGFANQYAGSVAFVMVEYWLQEGENVPYRNIAEGTAFLIDKDGYLLTNRHVACPWLEDNQLYTMVNFIKHPESVRLKYRIFLWFEGTKAFNRLPVLSDSTDPEDIYNFETAFRTDGRLKLSIAGVARPPVQARFQIKSPLKDDFAILKIETVPEGRIPLPLASDFNAQKIPKLSPVIALGFPLGSQTQASTVNVSVTRGHVRRTFENLFQVDTSIHKGNSGGPIIDVNGKVIGIASGVVMDWAIGPVPVATPLSDIGMILPITKAVSFFRELKAGQPKWKGVLDLSLDHKVKQIIEHARQRRWLEAQKLADKQLKLSLDPRLLSVAGMMHFCAGDLKGAQKLFSQVLSMDPDDNRARLLLHIIHWMAGSTHESPYGSKLLELDWRSSDEFLGYIGRILMGIVEEESALEGGYSKGEKSWILYAIALMHIKRGDLESAENRLKESILHADLDDWLHLFALAKLEEIQNKRISSLSIADDQAEYKKNQDEFDIIIKDDYAEKKARHDQYAPILSKVNTASVSMEEKRSGLKQLLNAGYKTEEALVGLAYYSTLDELWDEALSYTQSFLKLKGRENADRLRMGLLEPEIYYHMGKKQTALDKLKEYYVRTNEKWYLSICEGLLGRRTEQSLLQMAGKSPADLLTAHAALGFWSEGAGETKKAIKHYKEALGSYMDHMIEFEFVRQRLKKIKNRPQ